MGGDSDEEGLGAAAPQVCVGCTCTQAHARTLHENSASGTPFFVRYSARQGGREHLDTEAPQSMSHSCSFLSRPTAVYSRGHEPCSVEAMSHPTGEAQGHAFAC